MQLYAEKFKEIAAEVEDTLDEITSFTASAVSSSELEEKNKVLKSLQSQWKLMQSKLKGLPEIKSDLREMVLQCKRVRIDSDRIIY